MKLVWLPGNLQTLQSGFNIWEFHEYRFVGNTFVIEDEADTPHNWREALILFTGKVVQNDLGLGFGTHDEMMENVMGI